MQNFAEYKIICLSKSKYKTANQDVREIFKLSNRAALDKIKKFIELQVLKPKEKALQ